MANPSAELGRNPKVLTTTIDTDGIQTLIVNVGNTIQLNGIVLTVQISGVIVDTLQINGINTTVQISGVLTGAMPFQTVQVQGINTTVQVSGVVGGNVIIVADVNVQPSALVSVAARSTRKELWLTVTSAAASPARVGTTITPAAFTGQPIYANSPAVLNTQAMVMVWNPNTLTITLAVAELDS